MGGNKFKRMIAIFVSALMLILFAVFAVACGDKHTVTFYDGTTVIATVKVKDGEKLEKFKPADKDYNKEGFNFEGWFATSNFTHEFDFDKAIDKDIKVYSQWASSQADTRVWTIAGGSSAGGPLKNIGWNGGNISGANGNILTKTADKNEFKITINLYKGDEFQFCIQDSEGAWNTDDANQGGARGGQYLTANDYMAGASGGLGDGQVNIVVDVSGNYTLTLRTDALDKNIGKITVVRNGDAPEVVIDRSDYVWYIYGNSTANDKSVLKNTDWGANVTKLQYSAFEMFKISDNAADGTGTWMQTWTLDAGDQFLLAYCTLKESGGVQAHDGTMFYFTDIDEFNGDDACFKKADGMGSNVEVITGGTYTFILTITLNEETDVLEGSIEVDKTADILTAEQTWKVLGGRLSHADATSDTVGKLTIEKATYEAKTTVFENNKFGLGTTVQALTKAVTPASGMAQEYEITLSLVEGDYFYFCIPMAVHAPYREDTYYTPAYTSRIATKTGLPTGITNEWGWGGGNFLCSAAGDYTFKVSVSTAGALTLTVTAA